MDETLKVTRAVDGKRPDIATIAKQVEKIHKVSAIKIGTEAFVSKHIPTGIFSLDLALLGGIEESKVSMFYGWESSGKSTVALRLAASAQRKYPDKNVVFIDIEGTLSKSWAVCHGVNLERLYVVQPDTGEMAVDICCSALTAPDVSLIILDSIAALTPVKEIESSAEDAMMGVQARLVGGLMRRVTQSLSAERKHDHYPALLLINQFRHKMVMMGDPRVLPGGHSLRFLVSSRVEFTNKEHIGRDLRDIETVTHNDHSFKITKNKAGVSIRTGEFQMVRDPLNPLGQGFIDEGKTIVSYARKFGLFGGGGAAWRFTDLPETKFGRLDEAVEYLYTNRDFMENLKMRMIGQQRKDCGLPPDDWY
jgi:recombination protein RecA